MFIDVYFLILSIMYILILFIFYSLCNLEELVLSSNNLKNLPPSLGLLRNLRTLIADDNLLEDLPCEVMESSVSILKVYLFVSECNYLFYS